MEENCVTVIAWRFPNIMNLFRFSGAFSNQSFIYDVRMITIIAK